ncbi:MAG: class II aldolase/adducin family protein, partial [Fimbriimonadaceae bacterium]
MSVPQGLVRLSHDLGEPSHRLTTFGEGNTSARVDEQLWIKASGRQLWGIEAGGFCHVTLAPLAAAVESSDALSDAEVHRLLTLGTGPKPSVEAFMHAWLLGLPGVEYVGHVHGEATLALLCTVAGREICSKRYYPDEVVLCGPATLWVPYVDPGLALAREIAVRCSSWIAEHGSYPRLIALQNHGTIALGSGPEIVRAALLTAEKAARIVIAALSTGSEVVALSPWSVQR